MRRSRRGKEPEYQIDPEIERSCNLRNRLRLVLAKNEYLEEQLEAMNNQGNPRGPEDPLGDGRNKRPVVPPVAAAARRSCRDYMINDHVELETTLPDVEGENFELKPVVFSMINNAGQFSGAATEDAREHLKTFQEICGSFRLPGANLEILRLRLFPHSLRDRAKTWWNKLTPGSIRTWADLTREFLSRFNPSHLSERLRNEIATFQQEEDEPMHEAWDRFTTLLRNCPMHGFPVWNQVIKFYNAAILQTRMRIDSAANELLLDKDPDEAMVVLKNMAKNEEQFPTARRGGKRVLAVKDYEADNSLKTQVAYLTKAVENLLKKDSQPIYAAEEVCGTCSGNHSSDDCPIQLEEGMYVGNYNKQNYNSNNYNPNWRKDPKFSWSNPNNALNPQAQNTQNQGGPKLLTRQQPQQHPQQPPAATISILEQTLATFMSQTGTYMANMDHFVKKTESFMDKTEMRMTNHEATLKSLETQMGQVSQHIKPRQNGGFPSYSENARQPTHEQCKAITTRNGKKLPGPEKEVESVKEPALKSTAENVAPADDKQPAADEPVTTAEGTRRRMKNLSLLRSECSGKDALQIIVLHLLFHNGYRS
ncbi:hypothetical protein HRI_000014700 [Hibiscus trionum]|uniref:Retrotransposon gag domain-containing protein n=1 Tax=Hibiscus trionum TaxID=183268 RepID=A0A9W7LGS7_HIBTR|nr:hypothetical protein HRI_000014700 [Hibiscus trionum]